MKEKFALYITEDSGRLFCFQGKEISETLQVGVNSPVPPLLKQKSHVGLDVFWDVSSVTVKSETLPKIKIWNIWQLIQRKKQELSNSSAIWGQKVIWEKGRWTLVQVRVGKEGESWFSWLDTVPNPIERMVSVPYETLSILKKMSHQPGWQMMVTLHESGFMRLTIFNAQHLVLTRKLPLEVDKSNEKWAAQIAEAIEDSVQYLKRQHQDILEHITLYVVVDEEMRKFLKIGKLSRYQFQILTPYQLALRLGVDGKVPFRYSESVLIRFFIGQWGSLLPLASQKNSASWMTLPAFVTKERLWLGLFALVAYFSVDKGIELAKMSYKISNLRDQIKVLTLQQSELLEKRRESENYSERKNIHQIAKAHPQSPAPPASENLIEASP